MTVVRRLNENGLAAWAQVVGARVVGAHRAPRAWREDVAFGAGAAPDPAGVAGLRDESKRVGRTVACRVTR